MATNWLARYAARTVVRRVVYLVIAAALGWFGMGRAEAANCATTDTCAQPEAFAACEAANQDSEFSTYECVHFDDFGPGGYYWNRRTNVSNGNQTWLAKYYFVGECDFEFNENTGQCQKDCSAIPPKITNIILPNGTIDCSTDGCDVVSYYNPDGTSTEFATGGVCGGLDEEEQCDALSGYYWHAATFTCVPIEPEECDEGVTPKEGVCRKPDQCPTGMVEDENGYCKPEKSECPSGQTKGPDGSCMDDENKCGAGKVPGNDGTCKPDSDGDGEADEDQEGETDDTFSGGDDCNAPPTCSGSVILCGQARIQWRIDCNTRKATNVSGGSCDAVPVCTGEKCDALEYAQLVQQWRTTCAIAALASAPGEGEGDCGPGDTNCNGQPDWTENPSPNQSEYLGDGTGEPTGELREFAGDLDLDTSGFGWGSSCPAPPSIDVFGNSLTFDTGPFCDWMQLGGWFVLLLSSITSAVFIIRA